MEIYIPIKNNLDKWKDVKFETMYDDENDPQICKIDYTEDCKVFKFRWMSDGLFQSIDET